MQVWSEALIGLNRVENKKESATREGRRVNFQIDGNCFFFWQSQFIYISMVLYYGIIVRFLIYWKDDD